MGIRNHAQPVEAEGNPVRRRLGLRSLPRLLKRCYFSHFSRPASDRVLFRAVCQVRATRILEIGLASPARALRLIDLARGTSGLEVVRYVAIDLFEARDPSATGLSLKEAHRLLKPSGAQVQLIPGDAASALARAANGLKQMDLIVIAAEHDEQSLRQGWFYVPRLLHAETRVYQEAQSSGQERSFQLLAHEEIARLAASVRSRRAA